MNQPKSRKKYKDKHINPIVYTNNPISKKNKNKKSAFSGFYGSQRIPETPIINYMKNNFETFFTRFKQAETEHKSVIVLDDVFETTNIVKPTGNIYNLKTELNGNPNMPLDKLIAYSFYTKNREMFITKDNNPTPENTYLELLKYQMGKDIARDDRTIQYYNPNYGKKNADGETDTKKYTQVLYGTSYFSKYKNDNDGGEDIVADEFYKLIIKSYANHVNKPFDYNTINKIALLSCQNVVSLVSDLVTEKIGDMLSPHISSVINSRKNNVITFTETEQTMEFNFESGLTITTTNENGEEDLNFDPRGHLTFNFFVDLKNNNFRFKNFELSYESDNATENANADADANADGANNAAVNPVGNRMKLQYAIPVAAGVGGIVATPFILGALGGKKKVKFTRTRSGTRSGTRHRSRPRTRTRRKKRKKVFY